MMVLHAEMPASVAELEQLSHAPLSGADLKARLAGKCFEGLYQPPFRFTTRIGVDGSLHGENNYGTRDQGRWSIDLGTGAYSVVWVGPWDNTTTIGYDVDGVIHMFDVQTGKWRNALFSEIDEARLGY